MDALKESLHRELVYENGKLIRISNANSRSPIGTSIGSVEPCGYIRVMWKGTRYRLHQLIYIYHHGQLPKGTCIDHIDGNKHNNRIENLRPASVQENRFNSARRTNNTSGCSNVSWVKQKSKWLVYLTVRRKKFYFGLYDDYELAELVSQEARRKYHGEFVYDGKP